MRYFLLLICYITFSLHHTKAEPDSIYAPLEISLLTCKSGDALYSTFAHTALRLRNPQTKSDIVYNYGTFDTETPYFYLKFLRGQLPYKLSASTMEGFLRAYNYERRSVIEQKLNLTTIQKRDLFKALALNYKPENAFYKYDFFFDNCTTRTIDIIAGVTGNLDYQKPVANITFRGMLKQFLRGMPWSEFGIDLIIGAVADKTTTRRNQHFLPMYLYEDINQTLIKSTDTKLASTDYTVLNFDDIDKKRHTPKTNWPLYLVILLLVLEGILTVLDKRKASRLYDKAWFILLGVMGIVMAIMWFGTDHLATKQNYNLLWANLLIWPYLYVKTSSLKKIIGLTIIVMSLIAIFNCIIQFLPQYFLPAFGVMALITVSKIYRQELRKKTISGV